MKILVPVKRVPDPTQKPKLKDGHIDLTGASWIVNTFDEYAVETALRLLENGDSNTRTAGSEIVVVSLGPDDAAKEIRTTLAMGADRAILVEVATEVQPLAVAKVLKAIVDKEQPGLVIMGKQAIDDDCNQSGQMLAALLGWPQAAFISKIEVAGDHADITREVDGGLENISVKMPAVVTADLRLNEPRYVTLPNIMKAKKKPLENIKPDALGVDVTPRLTTLKVEEPPKRGAGVKVADVAELVNKLKNEAKVI